MKRKDERGTTALEFALLGPALAGALVAGAELSFQGAVSAVLDYKARQASRFGVTGTADSTGTLATADERVAAIKTLVTQGTGMLLNTGTLDVKQVSYDTISDVQSNKNGTTGNAGVGGAGQLVRYNLTYAAPLLMARYLPVPDYMSGKVITHTSTVLVKNEPYPTK